MTVLVFKHKLTFTFITFLWHVLTITSHISSRPFPYMSPRTPTNSDEGSQNSCLFWLRNSRIVTFSVNTELWRSFQMIIMLLAKLSMSYDSRKKKFNPSFGHLYLYFCDFCSHDYMYCQRLKHTCMIILKIPSLQTTNKCIPEVEAKLQVDEAVTNNSFSYWRKTYSWHVWKIKCQSDREPCTTSTLWRLFRSPKPA